MSSELTEKIAKGLIIAATLVVILLSLAIPVMLIL